MARVGVYSNHSGLKGIRIRRTLEKLRSPHNPAAIGYECGGGGQRLGHSEPVTSVSIYVFHLAWRCIGSVSPHQDLPYPESASKRKSAPVNGAEREAPVLSVNEIRLCETVRLVFPFD